jgi:hypothetical protein
VADVAEAWEVKARQVIGSVDQCIQPCLVLEVEGRFAPQVEIVGRSIRNVGGVILLVVKIYLLDVVRNDDVRISSVSLEVVYDLSNESPSMFILQRIPQLRLGPYVIVGWVRVEHRHPQIRSFQFWMGVVVGALEILKGLTDDDSSPAVADELDVHDIPRTRGQLISSVLNLLEELIAGGYRQPGDREVACADPITE